MNYLKMLANLIEYSENEKWKIIVYYILHVISIIGTLLQPYAFSMIINALQKNTNTLISDIIFWLLIYLLGFLIFNVFHRIARIIERGVAFRARKRFSISIYKKLESLPMKWHDEHHSGSIIDRVNKAAEALYFFGEAQSTIIENIIKFVGSLIFLTIISPYITLISLLVGFIIIQTVKKFYIITVPEYRAQNEGFHEVSATLLDYVKNIRTIIILKLGKYARKEIEYKLNLIYPHIDKENKVTQIKCFVNDFMVTTLNVILIFLYVYFNIENGNIVLAGSITALYQYLGKFMSSIDFYGTDYEAFIHWNTSFNAVLPILNETSKPYDMTSKIGKDWNTITVGPINFTYGKGYLNINQMNIKLRRGEKIAFIGESGSGKSTVMKILSGLMECDDYGKVFVDSKSLTIELLQNEIAYIPQEPEVFENTIAYNIDMGTSSNKEELIKFSKMACFDDVVNSLQNQFETDIRENGVNMSGGEKQRLALVRGLFAVKDRSIIFLDEPTGSLDATTEANVYTNIFKDNKDVCIVSILHKLHLLPLFDYVYVFKSGEIVQEGNFEQLKKDDGEFTTLWENYSIKN